jgi:acyl-CoA dehydrogenase
MSDTGRMIADLIEGLLAESIDTDLLIRAEDGAVPAELWDALASNGLTAMLAEGPEAEIGWREALIVVAAAGRHALPLPLPESIGATALLASVGLALPDGRIGLAGSQPHDRLRLRPTADGWRASGTLTRVPWGRLLTHVVADVAQGDAQDGEGRIACISLQNAKIMPSANIVGEPRDDLAFDDAVALVSDGPGVLAAKSVAHIGAILRAGQMAGAMDAILGLCVAYAGERQQFGRAIGNFQAIQHLLAQLAEESAAATMAAEQAFVALDRDRNAEFAIASAKIRTADAAGRVTAIAHAVHGAMGFAREHRLHHLTRRLMAWRTEYGADSRWARELAAMVVPQGGNGLWPFLTHAQTDAGGRSAST